MIAQTRPARFAAWLVCTSFVGLGASCQKIIGIEDIELCGACYAGPEATKNVGVCKAGCPGDGGECVGQVLPKTEDCSTPDVDDNCDGQTACTGDVLWTTGGVSPGSAQQGSSGPQAYVTLNSSGNLVVVGSTLSGIGIGKINPGPKNNKTVAYVATLAHDDGTATAVATFATSDKGTFGAFAMANDVATLPGDLVAIGGNYAGVPVGFVTDATKAPEAPSGFVTLYDTVNDVFVGGKAFEAKDGDSVVDLWAVSGLQSNGDVYACGDFQGTILFPDGTTKTSDHFTQDVFVVRLNNMGKVMAKAFFSGQGEDTCSWIKANENGDVAITGTFGGSDFAIGSKLGKAGGDSDVFVALLSSDLEPKWALSLSGPTGYEDTSGVVFDPTSGNLIVGGDFEKSLKIGDQTLESAGSADLFLAAIDPSGKVVWARAYGDEAGQQMAGLTIDAAGQIVVAGQFAGRLQADACDIHSSGGAAYTGADAFVMKLFNDGKGIWCKSGGDEHYQELASSVVTDIAGNVYASASFIDTFAFPGGAEVACKGSCVTGFAFMKLDP